VAREILADGDAAGGEDDDALKVAKIGTGAYSVKGLVDRMVEWAEHV